MLATRSEGHVTYSGKELERMSEAELVKVQKKAMEERIQMGDELADLTEDVTQLSAELTTREEDYRDLSERSEQLKPATTAILSLDEQGRIRRLAASTLQNFVRLEPRRADEQLQVDVRFLPGTKTTGHNLHIGGEGAGSLLARFQIKVDQEVRELAIQAAKYWGLCDDKVFFLDRGSRIVPGSMLLRDIVLPSAHASGIPSSTRRGEAGNPDTARTRANSLPPDSSRTVQLSARSTPRTEDTFCQEQTLYPVLEGRNYMLTLVRAGTILSEEDLREPKGQKWDDFTFNERVLENQLEETRRRHGDAGVNLKATNMDDIPSLYELMAQAQARKIRKRWDTRCRVLEFVFFLICEVLFVILTKSSSQNVIQTLSVTQSIEKHYLLIDQFEGIRSPTEYKDYFKGPLKKHMVLPAISEANLFVLSFIGFQYKELNSPIESVDFCNTSASSGRRLALDSITGKYVNLFPAPRFLSTDGDQANSQNEVLPQPKCVPSELKYCLNERVVRILNWARDQDHLTPSCHGREWRSFLGTIFSAGYFDHWGSITGELTNYNSPDTVQFDRSTDESFDKTTFDFTNNLDSNGELADSAKMVAIFIYSPTLNTMFVYRLLMEHTFSGTIVTTVKKAFLNMDDANGWTYVGWVFTIIFSILCLLMEIRRILGCPKRFFYEQEQDRCSLWTCSFVVLPISLIVLFVLQVVAFEDDSRVLNDLSADKTLSAKSRDDLFEHAVLGRMITQIGSCIILLMNLMFYRYLLMYLPQLSFVSKMVSKASKPLCYTLFYLFCGFVAFGTFMYGLFSSKFHEYRNVPVTIISSIKLMMGGVHNWWPLYQDSPVMFGVVMAIFFVVITIFVNNLALAIMLSHKKEKDLVENYNYHIYWDKLRSKLGDKFNPATAGWDFTENVREPKNAAETEGQ